jgi:UDP-N-acetylglucosamine acyltransferase
LKRAFQVLYCSGLTIPAAIAELESDFSSPHVHELCEFIRSSKRGICSPRRNDRRRTLKIATTEPSTQRAAA